MNLVDPLIQELKHEAGSTRKLLERIPEEHFDWKPHEKSMGMGQLGSHIADSIQWAGATLDMDEMVMDMETYKPFVAGSKEELLKAFDDNVAMIVEPGHEDLEVGRFNRTHEYVVLPRSLCDSP